MRQGLSPIDREVAQHPDLAFFAERNPGHVQGEELVCLAKVRWGDLARAVLRIETDQVRLRPERRLPVQGGVSNLRRMINRLLVIAGNMSGDMFGVAAALLLDPSLGVLILQEVVFEEEVGASVPSSSGISAEKKRPTAFAQDPSKITGVNPLGRCKSEDLAALFTASCGNAERVFVLPVGDLGAAYTSLTKKAPEALSYAATHARREDGTVSLCGALGVKSLEKRHLTEVSEGTKVVGTKDRSKIVAMVREAWGLKVSGTFRPTLDNYARQVLEKCGKVPNPELRYAVLWLRFSGKKGGPHPQHDTSYTGLRQLIGLCERQGLGVILCGDQAWDPPHKAKLAAIVEANESRTFVDLTEMWTRFDWQMLQGTLSVEPRLAPIKNRIAQFAVLDFINRKSAGLLHLGFRSGNLEAFSLLGHRVYYLEEAFNQEKGRMEDWHSKKPKGKVKGGFDEFKGPRYDRITIDLPPSTTGKFIVTKLRHGTEKRGHDNMVHQWGPKLQGKGLTSTNETRSALKHEELGKHRDYLKTHIEKLRLEVEQLKTLPKTGEALEEVKEREVSEERKDGASSSRGKKSNASGKVTESKEVSLEREALAADVRLAPFFHEGDLNVIEGVLEQAMRDQMTVDDSGITHWAYPVLGTG